MPWLFPHPQMYLLYKDPQGKTIFTKGASTNNSGYLAANLANKVEQDEMGERIAELEQLLNKVSSKGHVIATSVVLSWSLI